MQAGRIVVQKHGGYFNAVSTLFPEIKFEHNSFQRKSYYYFIKTINILLIT